MHKNENFCNLKMKFVFFFSSVLVKIPENGKEKKKCCGFTLFETQKKVFLQVCEITADNHVFFFTKSANRFRAGNPKIQV